MLRTHTLVAAHLRRSIILLTFFLAPAFVAKCAQGVVFSVVHSFNSGNSPVQPDNALVQGGDGALYGTSSYGGGVGSGYGTVYKVTTAGVLTVLHSFGNTDGSKPTGRLAVGNDGNLYGCTAHGGANMVGEVYKITPQGAFTPLYGFSSDANGYIPTGIIKGSNGNFYGMCQSGGANSNGTIFEITPAGVVTTLYAFGSNDGQTPIGEMAEDASGNLYGCCQSGGANSGGTLFKLTSAGVFSVLYAFSTSGSGGHSPNGDLIIGSDGNIYGLTNGGIGAFFQCTPSGTYTAMYAFTGSPDVNYPIGGLVEGAPGTFYGNSSNGGTGNNGAVFSVTSQGGHTVLASMSQSDTGPGGALCLAADGKLYGTLAYGQANVGAVFSAPTTAGVLTQVTAFTLIDGVYPNGPLIHATNGNFYGACPNGGKANRGAVYSLTPNGTESVLHDFTFPGLLGPQGGLLQASDGKLYGTCTAGGIDAGGVFSMTTGGTFTDIYDSDPSTTYPINRGLIQGVDGNFYGTVQSGGANYKGLVFKLTPAGTFTDLHDFTGTDGSNPNAGLVDGGDGFFYGATPLGGANSYGTVFKINSSGHFTSLYSFDNTHGANPAGALIVGTDGNLYGVTAGGGLNNLGTVFEITKTGTPTTLHSFAFSEGFSPDAGLVQDADGTFYGTTSTSQSGDGIIFNVTKGGTFRVLHSFSGIDGQNPEAPLLPVASEVLLGTTNSGGAYGQGVVFRLAAIPDTPTNLAAAAGNSKVTLTWTAAAGASTYSVYRGLTSNHETAPAIASVAGTTYVDTSAANGTTYFYKINADDAAGASQLSNQAAATPEAPVAAPAGLTAVAATSQVTLNWSARVGANTYNVYRGTSAGGEGATAVKTGVSGTSYVDTGLTNGTTYYYEITSVNNGGESGKSAEVHAMPTAAAASIGTLDYGTQGSWKGNYGADGYNVIGDTSTGNPSYPSYAVISTYGATSAVWTSASTATYALQAAAAGSANRMAGVWYSASSFSIDLNLTDGNQHQVALYLLDWGNAGRQETITIRDASNNYPMVNNDTMNGFSGGLYAVCNVTGHVVITISRSAGANCVLSGLFFGTGSGSTAPATPTHSAATPIIKGVSLSWAASSGATSYNIYRSTSAGLEGATPYKTVTQKGYADTGLTIGTTYYYQVMAVNAVGGSPASAEVSAKPVGGTASFVTKDITTQGTWKGNYGLDGYNIIADTSANNPSYPSYATVTPYGSAQALWTGSSTQPYALQAAAVGSTTKLLGVWYASSTFSIDVNLTDGNTHQFALYVVDWLNAGRSETITLSDGVTHQVLDTKTASAFANGAYYVWNLSGNVVVTVTRTAGANCVVSGLFFK